MDGWSFLSRKDTRTMAYLSPAEGGECCCLPVLGTEEALVEPMLLALDTTLPLRVLSTKSPGKERPQSLKGREAGALLGPQIPVGIMAP